MASYESSYEKTLLARYGSDEPYASGYGTGAEDVIRSVMGNMETEKYGVDDYDPYW